jgi:excinuclease ABC subunit C
MEHKLHKIALSFPKAPGVYLFKNKNGVIIYIGKAAILRNRVSQYFQSRADYSLKTTQMVRNAADLEYIVTNSELDALILESSLIKRYKPRYNILLKDDKGYPFIRLDYAAPYPVFEVVNRRFRDGAEYFGPYGGRNVAFGLISSISEALRLPICSRRFPRDIGKERPCLHYRTGRCFGPCINIELRETYRALIGEAVMILKGNYEGLEKRIIEEMESSAETLDFERAAILRDRLRSVNRLGEKQKIITSDRGHIDAVGCSYENGRLSISVISVAGGQIISQFMRVFQANSPSETPDLLSEFLKQYYIGREELPDRILVSYDFEDLPLLRDFLSQKRKKVISIEKPTRGVNLNLLKLAEENAKKEIERVVGDEEKSSWRESELCRLLGLKPPLHRIEAFDISNTSGADIVASMVVFKDLKPCKSEYRTYAVKSLKSQDDYGAIREVMERRGRKWRGRI